MPAHGAVQCSAVRLPCRPARFPINSAQLAKEVRCSRICGAMHRREYLASESPGPVCLRGRHFLRHKALILRPRPRSVPFLLFTDTYPKIDVSCDGTLFLSRQRHNRGRRVLKTVVCVQETRVTKVFERYLHPGSVMVMQ